MTHDRYMRRTFSLAKSMLGHTAPNPAVGAVIVNENGIVSTGGFIGGRAPCTQKPMPLKRPGIGQKAVRYTLI